MPPIKVIQFGRKAVKAEDIQSIELRYNPETEHGRWIWKRKIPASYEVLVHRVGCWAHKIEYGADEGKGAYRDYEQWVREWEDGRW